MQHTRRCQFQLCPCSCEFAAAAASSSAIAASLAAILASLAALIFSCNSWARLSSSAFCSASAASRCAFLSACAVFAATLLSLLDDEPRENFMSGIWSLFPSFVLVAAALVAAFAFLGEDFAFRVATSFVNSSLSTVVVAILSYDDGILRSAASKVSKLKGSNYGQS